MPWFTIIAPVVNAKAAYRVEARNEAHARKKFVDNDGVEFDHYVEEWPAAIEDEILSIEEDNA